MRNKIETFIQRSPNGHRVKFKIGAQVFSLSECVNWEDEDYTSLDTARMFQDHLNRAFKYCFPDVILKSKKYKDK